MNGLRLISGVNRVGVVFFFFFSFSHGTVKKPYWRSFLWNGNRIEAQELGIEIYWENHNSPLSYMIFVSYISARRRLGVVIQFIRIPARQTINFA